MGRSLNRDSNSAWISQKKSSTLKKKRKQRMPHRPGPKKRGRETKTPPTVLSIWDKFLIFAVIGGAYVFALGFFSFLSAKSHENAIQQRVERWQHNYNLTDLTAEELLRIETEFYPPPRLFSENPTPTKEQASEHRRKVNTLLGKNPEAHH